jgi:hypothetical protein
MGAAASEVLRDNIAQLARPVWATAAGGDTSPIGPRASTGSDAPMRHRGCPRIRGTAVCRTAACDLLFLQRIYKQEVSFAVWRLDTDTPDQTRQYNAIMTIYG